MLRLRFRSALLLAVLGLTALGSAAATFAPRGSNAHAAPAAAATRRVVAYFPIWNPTGGYTAKDIDFSVVNTVAHFAVTPQTDGSIKIPDWGPFPDADLVSRTHAAGARIVLVVGGDDAASAAGFTGLSAAAATRGSFVANLMRLVTANGYDGVDLDWEFPQNAGDRANLSELVTAVRQALGPSRTLSLTAPASDYSGKWYDAAALLPKLDWLGVMTYDLSGASWSPRADDNSALYSSAPGELSVDSSASYWQSRGVPAAKLLIGLPFFGQRFDGAPGLHQPLQTTSGGAVDYHDITALLSQGWTAQRDSVAQVPYLVRSSGEGVISYDDATSIAAKCAYEVQHGLGGAILWRLGQDGSGANQPLLQAARACR